MHLSVFFLALLLALSNARTILWTAAGGNPLWNNAGNWDCLCLPTIADDVVIDISTIQGNVLIGGVVAPALANSLSIGGTSRFSQTLTLNGPLTLGKGTSHLYPNGKLFIDASPDSPLVNDGTFNIDGSGFVFESGVLKGAGSFVGLPTSVVNLTGSATKGFSTSFISNGKVLTETDIATSLSVASGSIIIGGTFSASKILTISLDSKSTFTVKTAGKFSFSGSSLELMGHGYNIASWSLGSGSATIDNSIISGSLDISGGSLTLIGGPTDIRKFSSVTGSGSINNLGGVNSFASLGATYVTASGGNITIGSGNIGSLVLSGAYIMGGKISSSSTSLSNGFICGGLVLSSTRTDFQGVISVVDDKTSIVIAASATVSKTSLLTFSGGSSLQIPVGSTFSQSSNLQIVQGAPTANSPFLQVDGTFSSSATVFIALVPVTGSGSFSLLSGAAWTLNSVKFSTNTFTAAAGAKVSFSVGSLAAANVLGNGDFNGNPNSFSAYQINANSITLNSGNIRMGNVTLNTLTLNNGVFIITSAAKIAGTFSFLGGKLSGQTGTAGKQVPVSVGKTAIAGAATQALDSIALTSNSISFNCGLSSSCQFFSSNSVLATPK